jgi:hypothetical protein
MAEIVDLQCDTFRPVLPPADVCRQLKADAWMLARIEVWARSQRQAAEHDQTPLEPAERARVMRVLATATDQPVT